MSKNLVAYFSASGRTRSAAQLLAEAAAADLAATVALAPAAGTE